MALVGREDTHTLHDDWILQFNYLSTEFSILLNKGNATKLKALLDSFIKLWDNIKGVLLNFRSLLLHLSTLCAMVQLKLLLNLRCNFNFSSTGFKDYKNLLDRFFPDVEYKFLEKMRLFMNLLKRCTQGVLFKLSVKIGVLLVLLEYSYDCNYDAMEMLLEIAKLLPLSTTAVTNIWLLILDICQYLQPEPVSIEKLYYFAWRSFVDGDHDNSLKLLNEAAASTYGINIFNILKGNLYVKEKKKNSALICYQNCFGTSLDFMKLALMNSSCLFQKYGDSLELKLRSLLVKMLPKSTESSFIYFKDGKLKDGLLSKEQTLSYIQYSGLRLLQNKQYDLAISSFELLINENFVSFLIISYLLIIKSYILKKKYDSAWSILCNVLKNVVELPTAGTEWHCPTKIQLHYMGCFLSLQRSQLKLAEKFGCSCLCLCDTFQTECNKLQLWIKKVKDWCATLSTIVHIGRKNTSKAVSFFPVASLLNSHNSTFASYTYTLLVIKSGKATSTLCRSFLKSARENLKSEKYGS